MNIFGLFQAAKYNRKKIESVYGTLANLHNFIELRNVSYARWIRAMGISWIMIFHMVKIY